MVPLLKCWPPKYEFDLRASQAQSHLPAVLMLDSEDRITGAQWLLSPCLKN